MYGVGFGYGSAGATTILKSGGAAFDADAQSFFTASGVSDLTQKNAVNQLVLDLKSNSLWAKMKALYPVVGGNATAHSYNLKNTAQYQLSFSSGWTHSSTGMLPNGTSAYANTGINPSTVLSSTSGNIGFYSRTNNNGNTLDFGVSAIGIRLYLCTNFNGSTGYAGYNGEFSYSATNTNGLYSLGRLSSFDSNVKLIRNGSTSIYDNNPSNLGLPNGSLYLGASNENGLATFFSSRELALSYISDGLTPTQVSNLYTCIQTFETSLSRNV
jgi:hypothetical protein